MKDDKRAGVPLLCTKVEGPGLLKERRVQGVLLMMFQYLKEAYKQLGDQLFKRGKK